MTSPECLQELLLSYAEEAKLFFYSYGLADLVVDVPIDHVAIKALNRKEYEEYIQMYQPLSKRISSTKVNNRDLATVVLQTPLDGGTFGPVELLEIMEPRPGVIATTHDLIDHIEIFKKDLNQIQEILKHKEVEFKMQSNEAHNAVVVEITEWGQEVKFTDRALLEIINTAN
ncbi:MAG TPA: VOC family protein [Patescibacteria group bacterium]|jgi:predicted metalloenzyme YecM|nr:VOC family protein [Patescibacteria group bacterium]